MIHIHRCFLLAGLSLAAPLCSAQAVVGRPCLFNDYFAEWRTFPAILRDPAGNLTCGRNRLNCGGATQGPPAAGDPAATAVRRTRTGPQAHFTYRDRSGNIQDLWFDRHREKDRWHVEQLNNGGRTLAPAAAGDPSGVEFQGDFLVAYRDLAGGIQSLGCHREWSAQLLNLGGATAAPMAAGEPAQLVLGGIRHVVYRDGPGSIHDLWFDGAWHTDQVNNGGASQAPPAVGNPVAVGVAGNWHICYRDGAGGIQDLCFDGSWHGQRLNIGGCTAAPLAQGNPCARLVDSVLAVTYRDLAGHIQDLRCDGSWQVQRLNDGGAADAPPAASDPVCLVPPSNWEYVAYVDIQGNAQLLSRYRGSAWSAIWLNAPELKFWGGVFVRPSA